MGEQVLTVRKLSVIYSGRGEKVEAVRDVDFSLAAGSVLGIIGGSGAGKSSIALALACLHDQQAARVTGEVVFQNEDLLSMTERQLDSVRGGRLGMIFQDPRGSLDPSMKVVRQVEEALRLHRDMSSAEARELALVRLADAGVGGEVLARAPYAHQLSSGLCQRVMITIALAGDPALLVADEPTGALDVTTQARIIALLKRKQRSSGLAMVFITHDLGLVAAIADTILVMRDGRAVEHGTTSGILNRPAHDYTRRLLQAWKGG